MTQYNVKDKAGIFTKIVNLKEASLLNQMMKIFFVSIVIMVTDLGCFGMFNSVVEIYPMLKGSSVIICLNHG